MQANTKLTAEQKSELRDMLELAEARGIKVICDNKRNTLAYRRRGNTTEFAISVKAPNEKKYRRKVGKYWALLRFLYGHKVAMNSNDFDFMVEMVFDVYDY
jgi:hypothetical protein